MVNFGGPMVKVRTNREKKVFAYYREKDGNRVLVFLNLTRRNVSFKPDVKGLEGEYSDYFAGTKIICRQRPGWIWRRGGLKFM